MLQLNETTQSVKPLSYAQSEHEFLLYQNRHTIQLQCILNVYSQLQCVLEFY